ncbi:Macrophage mannose receptor 1-like protein, partial [Leptotrombidium deliense]
STLVSIRSQRENEFVKSLLSGIYGFWLSAYRVHRGQKYFKWIDNSDMSYTHWLKNEPDDVNFAGQICVLIKTHGAWIDVDCDLKQPQLCEKSLNTKAHIEHHDFSPQINELKNSLSKLVEQKFSLATQSIQHLANRIDSLEIIYNNKLEEKVTHFDKKIYEGNKAIDKLAKTTVQIADSLYDLKYGVQDTVNNLIDNITKAAKKWKGNNKVKFDSSVEFPGDLVNLKELKNDNMLSYDCHFYNKSNIEKCYIIVKEKLSFLDAQNSCEMNKASLLSITTDEENDYITSKISSDDSFWTGGMR